EAERQSATMAYSQGLAQCNAGEVGSGLLWLARSLELCPFGAKGLERAIRTNLASWFDQVNPLGAILDHEGRVMVRAAVFSPDGRSVLSASGDKALYWDIALEKVIRAFEGHKQEVYAVAMSPDGKVALTGSMDHTVKLWDVMTGEQLTQFNGHEK